MTDLEHRYIDPCQLTQETVWINELTQHTKQTHE